MNQRPSSLVAITILHVLSALVLIIIGIIAITRWQMITSAQTALDTLFGGLTAPFTDALLGGLPALLLGAGLIAIAFGLADVAVAIGVWQTRSWSWRAALVEGGVLAFIALVAALLTLTKAWLALVVLHLAVGLFFPGLLIVGLAQAIGVWYLLLPATVEAFRQGGGASPGGWGVPVTPGQGGIDFGGSTVPDVTGVPESWGAAPIPPTVRDTPAAAAVSGVPIDKTRPLHEPSPVVGWLVVRSGPRASDQLKLRVGSNTIGRDGRKAHLVVEDPSVSGEHAKVRFENGVFVIYDLASTNGTYVNGHRVEKQRLMDNDLIRLGRMECVFKTVERQRR